MKNLLIAIRSLFKEGRHNVMKIVSLAVGLAVGLVLIAKVYLEQSYDDFFPDGDRIFRLYEVFGQNGELKEWPNISGGVVVGMKENIPRIELATRFTGVLVRADITMAETKKKYEAREIAMADSCFFDMFPRRILVGDPKTVLSAPDQVMISDRLARMIGGDVVGKTFTPDDWPGSHWTIGGIFEEIPENSHLHDLDVLVSLVTYRNMMAEWGDGSWDGTMNWLGNDRYRGYIKLMPGVRPEDLKDEIRAVQEKYQSISEMEKQHGMGITYSYHNLKEIHNGTPEVKRSMWLLSLLAFALIFTAVMNYILIVISSIINRTKEVSVCKCYGASLKNIHGMIFTEAFLHVAISVGLAILLVYFFRGTVEELLDASVEALFLSKGAVLLAMVCIVVLLATGLVPGYLFGRIPVMAAFRGLKENKRIWKLALLFVQFTAAGFLLALLLVIGRQYNRMVNDNPGYRCDEIAVSFLSGTDSTARRKVIDEMMRLPEVKAVSSCGQVLYWSANGNNIFLPGNNKELFNIADLYYCSDGYLEMMEIPVIEGRSFTEGISYSGEVMVSRNFMEKMSKFVDWPDGPIGKQILVTEHGEKPFTICGVFDDFRLGSISNVDERPKVLFYSSQPSSILLVQFHTLTAEGLAHAQGVLDRTFPDRKLSISSYRQNLVDQYTDARRFRNAVLIGGVITLLISLIGLVGYTNDEVNRRRKEMAIRKVNGATIGEVVGMFLRDIVRIALPAVLLGGALAYTVAGKWQEQFAEKVPLSWYLFVGCGVIVLAVIGMVVIFSLERAARENPVNCLKSE